MIIQFTPQAVTQIKKLEKKEQAFIKQKLQALEPLTNKELSKHPKIKKLTKLPYLRFRCGDFRIFFNLDGQIMMVLKINKRNEKTYKK